MTRVWITRAPPGADRTADALRQRGLTPVVVPVLRIQPLNPALDADPAALAFTSVNGVTAFAALTSALRDRPVFAVGDRTARAARDVGFTTVSSAGGDARDLAALISAQAPDGLILVPCAETPAADLSVLLPDHDIRLLAVYRAVETDPPAPDFDILLIHSPRAARACARLLAPDGGKARRAVAISEAAAAPLTSLGFETIAVATRPDEPSVLTALDTLLGKPVLSV